MPGKCTSLVRATTNQSGNALPLGTIHKEHPHGGEREGVQKSADFADKQYYKDADKGRRGSKIPKILRTSFMNGPLVVMHDVM